jgi:hypothetical protein
MNGNSAEYRDEKRLAKKASEKFPYVLMYMKEEIEGGRGCQAIK